MFAALCIELPGAAAAVGRAAGTAAGLPSGANPLEQRLIDALAQEDLDADQLLERTGAPASAGLAALTSLELAGAVHVAGDGRWSLVRKR